VQLTQTLYNPSDFNDRLLLGLRERCRSSSCTSFGPACALVSSPGPVAVSYPLLLPIGLLYDPSGKVVLDSDARVGQVVCHLLVTFARTGSARATVQASPDEGLSFLAWVRTGVHKGELTWMHCLTGACCRRFTILASRARSPMAASASARAPRSSRRPTSTDRRPSCAAEKPWRGCWPSSDSSLRGRPRTHRRESHSTYQLGVQVLGVAPLRRGYRDLARRVEGGRSFRARDGVAVMFDGPISPSICASSPSGSPSKGPSTRSPWSKATRL